MACLLNTGRLKPCKDAVGGVRSLYFVNYDVIKDVTYDTDGETILSINQNLPAPSVVLFRYDIRSNAELTQNITSSKENGTTFFEQVLTVEFTGLTKEDNEEIKRMIYSTPYVFIEDFRNNIMLVGLENGVDVTEGNSATGREMGDFNGYNITLTSKETAFANFFPDFDAWIASGIAYIGGYRNSTLFRDRVLVDGGIIESPECLVQE